MAAAVSFARRPGVHALLGGRPSAPGGLPRGVRDDRRSETGGASPSPGAGRTLDDVLLETWQQLSGHAAATCPVCRGPMAPRYGSEPAPVGGRCRRCGSTLE
jgi:hypothetical protein